MCVATVAPLASTRINSVFVPPPSTPMLYVVHAELPAQAAFVAFAQLAVVLDRVRHVLAAQDGQGMWPPAFSQSIVSSISRLSRVAPIKVEESGRP